MPDASMIPPWTGLTNDVDSSAWWGCQLGGIILPGVITCEGFEREQDVDVKKAKGKDKGPLENNGAVPSKGTIKAEISARHFAAWSSIIRELDPQKPGAEKVPREIVAPLPNLLGTTVVFVKKISVSPPTASGGMTITLDCIEWTEAPKDTKQSRKPQPATETFSYVFTNALNDDTKRLNEIAQNTTQQPAALNFDKDLADPSSPTFENLTFGPFP